ncbi:tetrahydromethanopterin S-methyltransferase subunit F [Methanobacterium sp. ACI-7]|uniref:tetrahydromethanopterin S-methyltransferase subunit F n=1 Tax=unclassified Methanobacterium TaxID=2627676 RepID=UPI0039C2E10F
MVTFSNKPNIRGLRKVVEDVKFQAQLIGRDQRLFAGLNASRVTGMAMGFLLAVILVGGPIAYILFRGA